MPFIGLLFLLCSLTLIIILVECLLFFDFDHRPSEDSEKIGPKVPEHASVAEIIRSSPVQPPPVAMQPRPPPVSSSSSLPPPPPGIMMNAPPPPPPSMPPTGPPNYRGKEYDNVLE